MHAEMEGEPGQQGSEVKNTKGKPMWREPTLDVSQFKMEVVIFFQQTSQLTESPALVQIHTRFIVAATSFVSYND